MRRFVTCRSMVKGEAAEVTVFDRYRQLGCSRICCILSLFTVVELLKNEHSCDSALRYHFLFTRTHCEADKEDRYDSFS